jgi:hypothetical protein
MLSQGLAESNMMAFEREHSSTWKSFIAKPGAVVPKQGLGRVGCLLGTGLSISLNELAAAMVDIAIQGTDSQVILNVALVTKGRALTQS